MKHIIYATHSPRYMTAETWCREVIELLYVPEHYESLQEAAYREDEDYACGECIGAGVNALLKSMHPLELVKEFNLPKESE